MGSVVRGVAVVLAVLFLPLPLVAETPSESGKAEAGKDVYNKCIACHSPDRNRTGPMHCGLFGRVSGTVENFEYSKAMRNAAITWNAETLDRFLEAPLEMVPGTSMGFLGVRDEAERRALIEWLRTLTASSKYCVN